MFGLFRLIGIVVVLAVAGVVVEPSWNGRTRSLTLRVRSAVECFEVVRALGDRMAGKRVVKRDRPGQPPARAARSGPAPVAAGPVSLDEGPQERLSPADREVLDRLIEEKTREE